MFSLIFSEIIWMSYAIKVSMIFLLISSPHLLACQRNERPATSRVFHLDKESSIYWQNSNSLHLVKLLWVGWEILVDNNEFQGFIIYYINQSIKFIKINKIKHTHTHPFKKDSSPCPETLIGLPTTIQDPPLMTWKYCSEQI